MRHLLAVVLLLLLGLPAHAGTVTSESFHSPALGRDWDYNLYTPTGYSPATSRYPVLYLLHGFGNTRAEWVDKGGIAELADRLIATRVIPPCLIVMPTAGETWYLDGQEHLETAFIHDLLPEIEQHHAGLPTRRGRLVAGVSMGGYGALRFVLRYPGLFAAAALMSPAIYDPLPPENSASRRSKVFMTNGAFDARLWQDSNYPALLDQFRASGRTMPLFVVAGSEDELHIGGHVTNLARFWNEQHWPGTFQIMSGKHNFEMWRRVMPDALRFLFHQIAAPETLIATTLARRPR